MFDHIWRKTQNINPGLAQLVARLLWEQDVGSSSLPSRTSKSRLFLIKQPAFATFYHICPHHYLPSALTISPDYLSQENSFFNVERTVLPCAHAPERYNRNSYSLRLKPTGGCISLHRGILNYNLFIRYAINKLRTVQNRKHIVTCHMTSLSQKQLDVWQVALYNDNEVKRLCKW